MILKMYLIGYNYSEAVNSESSIRNDIQDVLNYSDIITVKQLIQKVLLDMIFKMYLIGYNYSEAVNSESSIRHDIQDVLNWI